MQGFEAFVRWGERPCEGAGRDCKSRNAGFGEIVALTRYVREGTEI